jgi:SAM-dependent methyltransferase
LNHSATTAAVVTDYNRFHAERARGYVGALAGKTCMVVGCNTGGDCRYFVEFGAAEVHGLDVLDCVGADFTDERVKYFQLSAEHMAGIPDDCYDLVYCFATMEHVPDIDRAFAEMVRICRPNGLIYCVAAPLWHSRNGHHKGDYFGAHPWIHLRMSEAEIVEFCRAEGITDRSGVGGMDHHVAYMLNPAYFNMKPARAYVEACRRLRDVEMISNDLDSDDSSLLPADIRADLAARGYPAEELLAVVHTFIARKRP